VGYVLKYAPRTSWYNPRLKLLFSAERDGLTKPFGIYRRLCIARASDPKVRRISQDGGAVTALLLFALEKGIIDGAIVSGLGGIGPSIQFQSLPVRLRR